MRSTPTGLSLPDARPAWLAASIAVLAFLAYKLSDLREAFAFGHARWADAYTYWFARAHLDLGLSSTFGLNVEGVTGSGEPIFYLSGPPLGGLMQAGIVALLGGEYWTVRVLPLLSTLMAAGLTAALAYRLRGTLAASMVLLLFFGIPFVLEYGSSNEGHQVFPLVFGLVGYLGYAHFLAGGRWGALVFSAGCFTLGLGTSWLAGFMALAMLVHLWIQPSAWRVKVIATLLIGSALGFAVLALLLQQGMASGDFIYPIRRALERGGVGEGMAVGWGSLLVLQLHRYWEYFGPVVSLLSIYWLARRALPKPEWRAWDGWALLMWAPGLVYGFLLRDAAFHHDFLMLGFLPGAAFMATLGMLALLEDLGRITAGRPADKRLAGVAAALLLGLHTVGAVRSAQNFERQEHEDLSRGGARIARYLKALPSDHVVIADWSVSMASRVDGKSGERYVSLWPFIDYLVRRPVRVVSDLDHLRRLSCEVGRLGGKLVLLQQKQAEHEGPRRVRIVDGIPVQRVSVPAFWVVRQFSFDRVQVLHVASLPAEQCSTAYR